MKENRQGKKIIIVLLAFTMTFSACGSKSSQAEPVIYEDQPAVEQMEPDTITVHVKEENSRTEEKRSTPVSSSSSRSNKYIDHDNMRGFDPASEDDMDDNGMSRYMENNDEEGWD